MEATKDRIEDATDGLADDADDALDDTEEILYRAAAIDVDMLAVAVVVVVVIAVVVVVVIFLDDNVRLSVLDKQLGLVIVVANVERALGRSVRAGQMSGQLTRLRLRLGISPGPART